MVGKNGIVLPTLVTKPWDNSSIYSVFSCFSYDFPMIFPQYQPFTATHHIKSYPLLVPFRIHLLALQQHQEC